MPAVLATMLATVARFLVVKLIAVFGIAFVTGGVSLALLQTFKGYILDGFASLTPTVYQIAMLAGVGYALNIIFGAMAFKIALNVGKKLMAGVSDVAS